MTTPSPQKKTGLDKIAASILAPPQQPDEIGRLGVYRVLSVLGKGGMGMVFRAEDPGLRRLVALKIMLPELAKRGSAKDRFLREARLAATLEHDHVVTIHQVGEDRGIPFIAMSFLKGMSLDDWLKQRRPLAMPQILRIGRETAKGLAAAHDRGLIHRDIKPANLWLDGATRGRVKILDFGLARAEKEDVALTRSGQIVGTPQYMSPEQAAGTQLDARSDLFSLGVVLYRMCTGTQPFRGDNVMAVLMALGTHDPPSAITLNPETPPALSDLIDRLLRKKPSERVGTAKEVVDTISKIERERALQKLGAAPTETSVAPTADAARLAASQAFNFEDSTDSYLSEEEMAPERKAKEPATVSRRPSWMLPVALGGLAAVVVAIIGVSLAILPSRPKEVDVATKKDQAPEPPRPKPPEPTPVNPGPATPASPEVTAPAGSQGITVNLLPLVDVDRDKISGNWKVTAEGLECEASTRARIRIPYRPVGHYVYRIVFTRRSGGLAVTQFLSHEKKGFLWGMSAGGKWSGLELREGLDVGSSPKHFESHLDNNRRHESIVEVRGNLVRAQVDGKEECLCWTSFIELQMPEVWSLNDGTVLGLGSTNNVICFHEIEVIERSGPGEFVRPDDPAAKKAAALREPRKSSVESPAGFRFDALPLVNLEQDKVSGNWKHPAWGEVQSDDSKAAVLRIPYRPPQEYDLRTEFTRLSGNDGVSQTLVGADHQFRFVIGGWANLFSAFDLVDGKAGNNNRTTYWKKAWLTNGQRYGSLLQVRKDGVTAYLDDVPVKKLSTDFTDVQLAFRAVSVPPTLEVESFLSPTRFHRVEITEISGPGTFLRPDDPAAKKAAALREPRTPTAESPTGFRFDALPLVRIGLDQGVGPWTADKPGGELRSGNLGFMRIAIPYVPPAEYDLRTSFTRESGDDFVAQILVGGGRQFHFAVGAFANKWVLFDQVDGVAPASSNKTAKRKSSWLENGTRHESVVQVRKEGVTAFLDGELVTSLATDFSNVALNKRIELPNAHVLGLAAHNGEVVFHRVEIVEVSGPGSFVRPAQPEAKAIEKTRTEFERKKPAVSSPPLAVAPFQGAKAAELQRLWAAHLGRKVEETNSIGMRLRLIPPGEFTMGDRAFGDSKPHPVRLTRPFYIGACEVTRGEYGKSKSDLKLPQGSVSWNEAVEFCRQLSERPEERAAGRRYRLPTEAEWEYACRAGTTTKFHFGDELDLKKANFKGTDPPAAKEVGSYPPNGWRLHDMHGNLREWVADWYDADYSETGPRDDPQGPLNGTRRIVRGGGMSEPSYHSGQRTMTEMPDKKYSDVGFRVVCEIDGPAAPAELKMSQILPFNFSVFRVAYSPDGKSLAVCGDGKEVRIWDLTGTRKLRCTIAEKSDRASACDFDRTGSLLYVGAEDGVIRAWNATTGAFVEQFVGHTARVTGVAISETGERMVSSSDDKTVRLWNLKNPREPSVVLPSKKTQNSPQPTSHESTVSDCAIGADLAFSSTGDGRVNYWDLKKKSQLWSKRLHKDRIDHIVFAPDRESFATACHDGHVGIWTRSGELLQDIDIPGTKALGLAYSPESKLVAVGGNDAKVRVFDVASGQLLAVAVCPAKEVFAVAWSPDGRTIASGEVYGARAARLWDVTGLRSSWQSLFDGKTLDGWGIFKDSSPFVSIATIDGEPAIRITGEKNQPYITSGWRGRDFEAKIEFRPDSVESRCNGMIAIAALGGKAGLPFRFSNAPKFVFYSDRWGLDLEQAESKGDRILSTGVALPRGVQFSRAVLKPAGEWNRFEIVRLGDAVGIRLNDRFVDAFGRLHPKLDDGSEPDFGRNYFNLTRTAGTVYFRRIEVREIHALPAEYATVP
jgi:serine/threonine protein kinase/formylglycine-generating enzyme required for sulfatase activity